MTQGWFNHYDDPDDEYWEEQPVARSAPSHLDNQANLDGRGMGRASTSPADNEVSANSEPRVENPFQKSALVNVQLNMDRLPTQIKIGRQWKNLFEPSDYGKSIMDAYMHAVFEKASQVADPSRVLSRPPTLRLAAPILLRTNTSAEFQEIYSAIFQPTARTFHGPGRNSSGIVGLTVTATSAKLISVNIDPDWGYLTDPDHIAIDIINCCNRARAGAPKLEHSADLDSETDQALIARVVRHEKLLMGSIG